MRERCFGVMLAAGFFSGFMGGMASALLFVGMPVWAEKVPGQEEVLRAGKFELVDENGKVRAFWGLGPGIAEESLRSALPDVLPPTDDETVEEPTVWLVLLDNEGRVFSRLGPNGLYLYDKNEDLLPRVQLDLLPEGVPHLSLRDQSFMLEITQSNAGLTGLVIYDQEAVARAGIGLSRDGRPGLAILNSEGRVRAGLGLFPQERPGLFFYDLNGRGRAVMGLSEQGIPLLAMHDQTGAERALLSMGLEQGEPALAFYDQQARLMALLGSTEMELTHGRSIQSRLASSLVLYDPAGEVLWDAP